MLETSETLACCQLGLLLTCRLLLHLCLQVVDVNRTCKGTRTGGLYRYSCMVVVGNGNGVLGWGQGKAAEVNDSVQKAYQRACRNLYPVPRYNDHTIPETIHSKFGQVRFWCWSRAVQGVVGCWGGECCSGVAARLAACGRHPRLAAACSQSSCLLHHLFPSLCLPHSLPCPCSFPCLTPCPPPAAQVKVTMYPKAGGCGITASPLMHEIAKMAGIHDVGIKVHGSRNVRNAGEWGRQSGCAGRVAGCRSAGLLSARCHPPPLSFLSPALPFPSPVPSCLPALPVICSQVRVPGL